MLFLINDIIPCVFSLTVSRDRLFIQLCQWKLLTDSSQVSYEQPFRRFLCRKTIRYDFEQELVQFSYYFEYRNIASAYEMLRSQSICSFSVLDLFLKKKETPCLDIAYNNIILKLVRNSVQSSHM